NTSYSPEYEINIEQRFVLFSVTEGQETKLNFGSVHQPGAGAFGLFNSTTDSGLSTEHGYYHGVTYRYQRIGDPIDEMDTLPPHIEYTDMNKIVEELDDHIWDVGCYIIYPVLLLPCNNPDHNHQGEEIPKVWDAEQAANYEFSLQTAHVNVWPIDVTISLNDVRKEYSKQVAPFVGEANADAADRSWSYVGNAVFRQRDNIVVSLTTEASASSEVGGKYAITVTGITGKSDPNSGIPAGDPEFDKAKNYNIRIANENETSYLYVDPLTINIRTYIAQGTYVYGDSIQKPTYQIEGENAFMSGDTMEERWVYSTGGSQIEGEPKNVGIYEVGIDFSRNEKFGNYNIVVNGVAFLEITPREIMIDTFEVANAVRPYNGQVQYPDAKVTFKNIVDNDRITVDYNFYNSNGEIVNNPINVGVYTARVDENRILNLDEKGKPTTLNNNYKLVKNEGNVEYMSATVEIKPIDVHINVNNAIRIYHIPGSLKAVKNVTEGNWWEHPQYIDDGELPYTFGDRTGRFVSTDKIGYELYIDEYFDELKVHNGVVKIRFSGEAIDAGNYNITYTEGDLLVKDADFDELEDYLFVTFNGERYVNVADSVVYTGENLYGKFDLYTSTDAIRNALSISIATDAEGKNVTTSVVNAGTYYMVIKPNGAESPFTGEKILPFTVGQAVRNITVNDIVMKVHYDKLVFSSAIPGLQYSINGEAFLSADENNAYEYLNV
ncbi:MAG: hypothetical protein K2I78_05290, partial [Clostridia bacterium]|nr:hypothetical protein [Clostridia bacterium]